MAIVPVGADGSIRLYNAYGNTHLIVDVLGYLYKGADAATTTGRVVPLDAPFRVFDTRQPEFGCRPARLRHERELELRRLHRFGEARWCAARRAVGAHRQPHGHRPRRGCRVQPAGHHVHDDVSRAAPRRPRARTSTSSRARSVPNMSLLRYGTAGTDDNVINAYNFNGVGALPARRVRRRPRLVSSLAASRAPVGFASAESPG